MSTPQALLANNIEAESLEDRQRLEELYVVGKQIAPIPDDLPEPAFSDNAWYIGRTRYAFRDQNGQPIETPKQMLWRIAYNIATAERLYSENPKQQHLETARQFYGTMARQEFVANTPTMLNAANPTNSCRPASCCRWKTTSTASWVRPLTWPASTNRAAAPALASAGCVPRATLSPAPAALLPAQSPLCKPTTTSRVKSARAVCGAVQHGHFALHASGHFVVCGL
jgi:hypothetical protein